MKQKRNTKQRTMILDEVLSRTDHPSADDIYLAVREKDERISRGTVYRNLNVLAEDGEILHVKVPAADRYDLRVERHYHMFCTCCGKVFDAPVSYQEQYDRVVEEQTDFKISRHRLIFEGVCSECRAKEMN